MSDFNFENHPHRRFNILTGEWIQVSPHRAKRPWQGQEEETPGVEKPKYDRNCYLCPGNKRAGGAVNPDYPETYVFTNDFSALKLETPEADINDDNLLIAVGEQGICRVICFSPRHDLTLPEMPVSAIRNVVDVWTKEYEELGNKENINYVQIFENKGSIMGCSNPHPHGQIWAQHTIPDEPAKEHRQFTNYMTEHHHCLLCDYLKKEQSLKERIVIENDNFVVLVPFWAVWPYETLLLSKRHLGNFSQLTEAERDSLADIIHRITIRYDNIFNVSFPYSAGFHPSPTDGHSHQEWHFHMHFYPPLLRSATVKKFMVGYEMLANPQRDITAELSAAKLRGLPEVHYKKKK
ncbi:MAG TPA: UDP-glucose--hexose-1-phosphate uridylyltransferase [Balneolales bacterium]|nr:UDP-glucose--hexose-1-phosphate uridylyltransferase [Balneolales bacterium]